MSCVGSNYRRHGHPRGRRLIPTVLLALLCAAAPTAAGPQVVIIPAGPRDQFECSNGELARKRYQTTHECLTDLCGDVLSADRFSLYVEHPRTGTLVPNPCYKLTYTGD